MINLAALRERDLAVSLERDGDRVDLITPDGVRITGLRGQVLNDISRINPENAERMTVNTPVVTLRRSSLSRVPLAGENWIVTIPEIPGGEPTVQHVLSPDRPPEGGQSIGFIRLYLQAVEQST